MLFNQTNKTSLAVIGSTTASFLCASLLSSIINVSPVSAYTATINTDDNISLDILPTGDGTTIRSASVNIQSDCRAGYNLTIATPNGSSLYKYSNNTQSSSTASFTSVDGTSALSSSNNTNKWGYTLTNNPTSSTIFSPLSSTASTIKTSTETASPDNDIDDTFNINYGIKADSTIAPGTYQMADDGNGNAGSIVYYLTMDTTCTQYTVQFNPNGGTVTSGGNNPTQGIESGEPTKLASKDSLKAPTEASYTDADNNLVIGDIGKLWTFWGWNTQADGTGDWYKDREEVEDLASVGSTITLYAQWKQATLSDMVAAPATQPTDPKQIDHNLMQDMRPETCYNSDITTAANAPAATLLDYRGKVTTGDNPEQPEQYTVSKLADGLCWMTTNLNLGRASGGPNNDGTITLTSDDTDLADNTTFTLPVADTTSYTSTTRLPKVRLTNNSGTNANSAYYTWSAAVANTNSISTNPTTSICPKNWDLPASNQYTNLATKSSYSSSNQTTAAPSSFLINGGFTNGATFYQTSYSHYWSNDSSSTTAAYGVRVNSTSITASSSTGSTYGGNKYYRKNIRCVATQGRVTINYDGNGTTEYPTTGSVASQTNVEISGTNVQANSFTRTGWVFKGWNTSADGSGVAATAGEAVSSLNPIPSSTITLYAQWAQAYTIQYDGNGASNPNGMGATDSATGIKNVKQINISEGINLTLLASNYKRTGYGFVGWSTDSNAWSHFTDNDENNNPIIYGPNESITIDTNIISNASNQKIITMYAVWVPAKTNGGNPIYLQDFGIPECNALTGTTFNSTTGAITANKNSIIALTDKRDNQVYTVAKLADGNCWMIENLRLDNQYTMGQNQNDNNVTNQSLSQGYGGTTGLYGNFVGLANSESTNFSSSTTSNSVYKSSLASPTDTYDPANNVLEDIGTTNSPYYRFPRYNNNNTNSQIDSPNYTQDYTDTSSPSVSGTFPDANLYSYGNYYTWAAAIANTNHYNSSTTSEASGTSICPVGWHLPSSNGTTKEFGSLSKSYGGNGNNQNSVSQSGDIMSNRFRTFPNNFLYSGDFYGSSATTRGTGGSYWSRSAGSDVYRAYVAGYYSTSFYTSSVADKYLGHSVRCVVGNIYTVQYDANGADNPNGMGTTDANNNKSVKQVGIGEGTSITFLASNFKRDGYGFIGWSTDSDAWAHLTDNNNTNDPIIYGPMEDVVINTSVSDKSNITMYAVWVPAKKDNNNNEVYFQDFGVSECNNLTSTDFNSTTGKITATKNSIVALTDKRDNMVYAVAKLADDNCWMIENLRLDSQYTMGQNQNDGSVSNESLAEGYGGIVGTYGEFVGLADSESEGFYDSPISNSVYKSAANPPVDVYDPINNTLEDIGTLNRPDNRFPRYNNDNTNELIDSTSYVQNYTNASNPSDIGTNYRTDSNIYSYGNYYSWPAAMASTSFFNTSSSSESAGTSICPSGWTLPTSGSSSKDFGLLSQKYGGDGTTHNESAVISNRFRAFPNNYLYAGSIHSTSKNYRGSNGYYWSKSIYNEDPNSASYYLNFTYQLVDTFRATNRYEGSNVRCLISGSQ